MKKIAVLVSGGGTNLQALIDACNNKIIVHGKIELVISSNHNAYALTRAKENNIKSYVVSKKEYSLEQDFDEALLNILRENEIDLVVLAGYMSIISENIVEAYKNKIINIHPSLIPAFCGDGFYGLRVHKAALDYGVKITGATVHFVNEVVDGGEIIMQKAVNILTGDTPETLQKRVMEEAEWDILPKSVELICSKD